MCLTQCPEPSLEDKSVDWDDIYDQEQRTIDEAELKADDLACDLFTLGRMCMEVQRG